MLCSNSYVKEIKKLNIDLHDKKINTNYLDKILEDLSRFESETKDICFPIGFNSIRNYYSKSYLQILGFSVVQDYVCRKDKLDIVYRTLENLGYKEIENPFLIEVRCGDGKVELLNSCPEEKVFIKKENGLENYIAIFPENSKYYKVKGKKIIEETIILPEDPRKLTILHKLYRFNIKDFTDLLFLSLEYPKSFEEIEERDITNFISTYSRLVNVKEEEIRYKIQNNLANLISSLEKIRKYRDLIKKRCCFSLEELGVSFSDKKIILHLYTLFLSKGEELFSGYKELERILKIVKKSEEE